VAVLDAMLAPTPESRQGVQLPGPVPDVEGLGPDVDIVLPESTRALSRRAISSRRAGRDDRTAISSWKRSLRLALRPAMSLLRNA
jgi:hypothetical protein